MNIMKCLGHNENLGFLRIALHSIMIWFAILSYIVGIVRAHDGFYDLLTHHINSPNLLMLWAAIIRQNIHFFDVTQDLFNVITNTWIMRYPCTSGMESKVARIRHWIFRSVRGRKNDNRWNSPNCGRSKGAQAILVVGILIHKPVNTVQCNTYFETHLWLSFEPNVQFVEKVLQGQIQGKNIFQTVNEGPIEFYGAIDVSVSV